MAVEADCDVSTVLEEFRVASTTGFLVPGEFRAAGPPRKRHTDSRLRIEMQAGGGGSPFPTLSGGSRMAGKSEGAACMPPVQGTRHSSIEALSKKTLCFSLCPLCASVVLRMGGWVVTPRLVRLRRRCAASTGRSPAAHRPSPGARPRRRRAIRRGRPLRGGMGRRCSGC